VFVLTTTQPSALTGMGRSNDDHKQAIQVNTLSQMSLGALGEFVIVVSMRLHCERYLRRVNRRATAQVPFGIVEGGPSTGGMGGPFGTWARVARVAILPAVLSVC
jgi:hypothetical protein